MSELQRLDPGTISGSPYTMFEERWALLTAGSRESMNTMTVGWGGIGALWGLPVALCAVRPQRYTYGFMERENYFTLSFLGEEHRRALQICGATSGRDTDKIRKTGLTPIFSESGAPYFAEAELVLVCRKLYAQDMKPECFEDAALCERWYPQHDFHRAYVGEITEAWGRGQYGTERS